MHSRRRALRQARQKRPLQALMRQRLAQKLRPLALSLPLALKVLLFCFWQCQSRPPSPQPARLLLPQRPKPRVGCHLLGSTWVFSPKIMQTL